MSSKPPTRPPAAAPLPPGMDDAKMRDLYQRYSQARRRPGAEGAALRAAGGDGAEDRAAAPRAASARKESRFSPSSVKDGKVILSHAQTLTPSDQKER
jgi:hypothetical protein